MGTTAKMPSNAKKFTPKTKEVLDALSKRDNQSFAELAGSNASGSNLALLVTNGLAKTKEIQGAKTWTITAVGRKALERGFYLLRKA